MKYAFNENNDLFGETNYFNKSLFFVMTAYAHDSHSLEDNYKQYVATELSYGCPKGLDQDKICTFSQLHLDNTLLPLGHIYL